MIRGKLHNLQRILHGNSNELKIINTFHSLLFLFMSRIVEGMNRYSNVGSTNSGTSKFSPWSRIPVKDSSVCSFIHCQLLITNVLCLM